MSTPTKAEFQKIVDAVATLDKELALAQKDTEFVRTMSTRVEQGYEKTRDALVELQTQVAVLKHGVEELRRRLEESDRRLWMLVGLLAGAILSFAANLAIAWVRK